MRTLTLFRAYVKAAQLREFCIFIQDEAIQKQQVQIEEAANVWLKRHARQADTFHAEITRRLEAEGEAE